MKRTIFALLILVSMIPLNGVVAQDDDTCEAIIQAAMESTDRLCAETGDNQACYGHVLVQALPQMQTTPLRFAAPGDTVDLIQLQTLRVSPLDEAAGYWGIALMQLLAQIPNTGPEVVSLLVFGSVEVEYLTDTSTDGVWVEIQGADINIYERPSLSSEPLLQVWLGQFLLANGRLEDDSWLRVQVPGTGLLGWVNASVVTSEEGFDSLPVVDLDAPQVGPLQVFRLETGLETGSPCDSAPQDGLLVQTPTGVAEVTFLVNEVNIQMRATAFLQAEAGREMTISVLDGEARVQAQGVTQTLSAGEMTRIPLDENLSPYWPPSAPESYQGNVQATEPLAEIIAPEPAPVVNAVVQPVQPVQNAAPPVEAQPAAPPTEAQPAPPPATNQDSGSSDGGSSGGGDDSGGGGSDPAPGGSGGAPGGGSAPG